MSALLRARPLLVIAVALQPACYAYAPATLETVPAGAHVRALITPEAERQLLVTYRVQQGRILSGDLAGRDGDQVNLLVASVLMGTGMGDRPLYQQVVVAAGDILRLDVRRLDAFRTGVAVGVATAAAGAIAVRALGGWGGEGGGDGGGGTPESVRGWVVRIPIPWP